MEQQDVVDYLRKLLESCVVRVDGHTEGSGFFITPNLILTCAHVSGAQGNKIKVFWQDGELPAEIRWASPLGSGPVAPYPDLAVIEVTRHDDRRPAVWLDDHLPRIDAKLLVLGHSQIYDSAVNRTSGWFTGGGEYGDLIRLTDDEIPAGMSGAPVLNVATGGVCAVTKASRYSGLPTGGGVAAPIRALRKVLDPEPYRRLRREHDEYHRADQRWLELADRLPDRSGAIGRRSERELRRIAGQLPVAEHEDHLADYTAIATAFAEDVRHPLHDHGDVVSELAGLLPPRDGFPHLLSYAVRLSHRAGPVLRARLETWALMAGQSTGFEDRVVRLTTAEAAEEATAQPAAPAGPATVLVYVQSPGPDKERHRYQCEIWRYDDAGSRQLAASGPELTEEQLWAYLRGELPGLVKRGGRGRGYPRIELVLPPELFDVDVEHWQRPGRGARQLGEGNAVVIRDQERFETIDEEVLGEWEDRWAALAGQDVGATLLRVRCAEQRAASAFYGKFQNESDLGAVLLPDSPRRSQVREVLNVALDMGIPIVVWRRLGCDGRTGDHHECAGARLAEAVAEELAGFGHQDVPDRVRKIRNDAAFDGLPECGHDIVVLWDDPNRRSDSRRLTTEARHAGG